jgi:peptide/nickel transport system substrate-binding protein
VQEEDDQVQPNDDRVGQLIDQATKLRWNRRQILKRAAILGLSAPAISAVLAACGGGDDDDDDSPTATSAAPADATEAPDEGEATPEAEETEATDGGEPTATTGGAQPVEGSGGIINLNTTLGDSGIGNPIITSKVQLIEYYVFNRLMLFDDTGTLQPELAEDWSYSDDNLTITISLRETTWHDGEPFTADDVIFTFDTIQDEDTDTTERSRLQIGGEYVTWEKVDDRTITITTAEPFAPFLSNLQEIEIIPAHLLAESADINTDPFNRQPIGTGMYRLTQWESDQFIRLEPNENYWGGRPANDGVVVFFHADTEVGSAALDSGEIDAMFLPPEMQPRYEENPDVTMHPYVYYTPITLAFNFKHPVFQDIEVRRAVRMAIDRQSLNDTVTRGRGLVANNQYADTGPLDRYNDYDGVPEIEYNVEEANRILDEAGYTRGDDGIRVSPDGDKFEFNIITYSGFEEYINSQVILQEMLAEIGFQLNPQVVDYSTLEAMWSDPNDDPANRALELEEYPHPFEFDPDVFNELHSASLPPNGQNYMWIADDEIDRLIELGRTTVDPDERVEVYKELDRRRHEIVAVAPLYNVVDAWVTSNRLQGVADTPYFRWYRFYGVKDWWKES